MSKITKSTTLQDAIKSGANAARVLASFNMGCVACSGRMMETVEWGAMTHGVDPEELVARLNGKEEEKGS
ncbi:MAG: DUF1858 domain-containing protein [Nitrospinota bacterium]|nr:DUF1858 domain-containing protein [Nitrospinota bacterium]MDH5677778.1 DUF1858 domain-containing protein [Nitrospinota bacterium]MDH5757103.1 DUF1858 domain-containing protein [Nitrospinota bacterium]